MASIRVPDSGPLTEGQREEIREAVETHRRQNKLTFRDLVNIVGKGESTIHEVLKGTYRADCDDMLRMFLSWLDADRRARDNKKPIGFYDTGVFQSMRALAAFAKSNSRVAGSRRNSAMQQEAARIVVGYGPAGCGKSVGARALAADDPLSVLVRVDAKRGTDSGLAKLISDAVGFKDSPRGTSLCEFVQEKLIDSGRLLIIDEGHRLKPSGCEFVRDLADVSGVPILILATEEFYTRLTRVRTGGGSKYYAQFSRRVGYVCDLVRGLDGKGGEKRAIYSIEEIRAIFKADGVRLADDAADYLQAVACCCELGMLGLAANIFELALRSVIRGARLIDAAVLRKAARRVLIPAGFSDHGVLVQIDGSLERIRAMRPAVVAAAG